MCELEVSDIESSHSPAVVERRRLLRGAGGTLAVAGLLGAGLATPASAAPLRSAKRADAELIPLGTQAGPRWSPTVRASRLRWSSTARHT
ncbi:hypothetical protein [Streptomyces sp. NPDC056160]|uniref:hypothetical protein n=1 Tax=Streptomyces sp. NPDC056160 TaxID=3345731 RepID=UPI0035DD58B7